MEVKKKWLTFALILCFTSGALYAEDTAPATTAEPTTATPAGVPSTTDMAKDAMAAVAPKLGFGIEFGNITIGSNNYNVIKMKPDLKIGKFGMGLDLNFEFDADFNLRVEEWNSWQAILSKITYIRFSERGAGDPFYFRIGGLNEVTLGHGLIMYKYSNMLNYPNIRKIGLNMGMDLKVFGFETMVGNILDWDILGARLFTRPLYNTGIPIVKNIEIGATIVVDFDTLNPAPATNTPYEFTDDTNGRDATVWGFDIGVIILRNPLVNMDAFFDFVAIDGAGTGEILGVVGDIISLIPYRLEMRVQQDRFISGYFDNFYDASRSTRYSSITNLTNAYAGWLFSSGLALFEKKVGFDLQIESSFDGTTKPTLTFNLWLDKALLKKFGLKFSWIRQNIVEFADVFKYEDVNSIMLTEIEYFVSDNLAITLNYKRTFEVDPTSPTGVVPFVSTTINTKFSF